MTDSRPRISVLVRFAVAFAAVLLCVTVTGAADAGRPQPEPLGGNLVKNPGAEDGNGSDDGSKVKIPSWTVTNSFTAVEYGVDGFPTIDDAPSAGGANFFAGGPNADGSRGSQDIDVSKWSDLIDNHKLNVRASAFQAGYEEQGDNGQIVVQFVNGSGKVIGNGLRLAKISGTDFAFTKVAGKREVPANTRKLRVILITTRVQGNYIDAYFDNIAVRLVRRPISG